MKEITRDQYLQLVGLITLAEKHTTQLRDIERAACAITGDEFNGGGHTSDAVWTDHSGTSEPETNDLLRKLDITVTIRTLRRKMKT